MCNCGNKRSGIATSSSTIRQQPVQIPTQKAGPDIVFRYTGQSALTATGNVTGRRYRFNTPGDQQLVDYRDAGSMAMVPVLQRMG